jgi:phosphoserine phosphatase
MVCIVDFDGTYFRNDYFKECFYRKLLKNPFSIFRHFLWKRKSLLALKYLLLEELELDYDPFELVNSTVSDWVLANKSNYDQVVLVSATPQFFLEKILVKNELFDSIYGSTSVNLKGKNKLNFILEKFGSAFDYIGDSSDDTVIFRHAKNAFKVKFNRLYNV